MRQLGTEDFAALVAIMRDMARDAEAVTKQQFTHGTAMAGFGDGMRDQIEACANAVQLGVRDAAGKPFGSTHEYLATFVISWHHDAVELAQEAAVQALADARAYRMGRVEALERLITYFIDLLSGKEVVADLIAAKNSGVYPHTFAD